MLENKLCLLLDSQFEEYLFYLEDYYDRSNFPSNRLTRREQVKYLMDNFDINDLTEVLYLYFPHFKD